MKNLLVIVLSLCLAGVALAETNVNYGWEDGGTVLDIYPDADSILATNVASWTPAPVYDGNFSLCLVDNAESGTPQAFLAYIWFLNEGDEVTVGFYRYDDTPDSSPSVRIWGHWNNMLPDDPSGYDGSAGGNEDYGPGTGWDYTEHTWTVEAGMSGLVVEARTYSGPGDTVFLDNLYVSVPDHAYVQIPGCSPVGNEHGSWSSVKNLYR